MIYYICGKYAVGKDSIFQELVKRSDLKRIIPYTTRPMRPMEKEGEEYHFLLEEEFLKLLSEGKMMESRSYDTAFGLWYYGTAYEEGFREKGKGFLCIGTLESYNSIKDYLGQEFIQPVYIELEDELRLSRAKAREQGNDPKALEELERRFQADNKDFSEEKLREAGIKKRYHNLDFDKCVEEILADIKSGTERGL